MTACEVAAISESDRAAPSVRAAAGGGVGGGACWWACGTRRRRARRSEKAPNLECGAVGRARRRRGGAVAEELRQPEWSPLHRKLGAHFGASERARERGASPPVPLLPPRPPLLRERERERENGTVMRRAPGTARGNR
eukprot:scaffold22465_cov27-Tisochrysis_lutea.AAC.4